MFYVHTPRRTTCQGDSMAAYCSKRCPDGSIEKTAFVDRKAALEEVEMIAKKSQNASRDSKEQIQAEHVYVKAKAASRHHCLLEQIDVQAAALNKGTALVSFHALSIFLTA